ncbi:GGDEF domain-containing protein [Undibacterium cyanobacteriorum]|uniref:diguanylate cyclase n=1 Tax=Undibacterium cyanobacteriorum TaxID=3073561 RepID=A0ABY9RKA9_9BURK|nr:GGDEF domain-containing protein [Undibacterium sp. 20NA77.5]WMW81114.1 GGDEF domain-containing protein [Undibacterium sp. 20NA77.5]
MESIIKHLMEITGHRDHDLLNISVISALSELTNAGRARVLDILHVGEKAHVKPQITIIKGKLAPSEEMSGVTTPEVPIEQYPQLAEALRKHENVAEHLAENGDRTLWLPVWMNEKVNVCLEIQNPETYTENTKEVMGGILVVYRNFQNLLDYSERDSLTGLLNRKTFDDNFSKILRTTIQKNALPETEVEIERRHNEREKQHWLAVLDIDHFKRVNDQFGHLYGDEVLILVANLMRSSFRPTDKLFRFGGEEFVILLRSTSKEDAKMIFERFRENVARYPFPQVGTVTISIGFAHIDPFEPAVGIIGRADQALYFAKSNGRNRVCHYEDLVSTGELRIEVSQDSVEFF